MSANTVSAKIIELLEKEHLLSVKSLLSHLATQGRDYNKTSVYRALDALLAQGIICKHHLQTDEALYELREHHHSHLVCTKCGTVSTTACLLEEPTQIGDFIVDHHHTTLFGICGNCQ